MRIKLKLFVRCVLLLLTVSCGAAEINERKFITSIGIDTGAGANGARFKITMASPAGNGESEEGGAVTDEAEDTSITGAFYKAGQASNKKPYLGHLKACVISRGVLSDRILLKETLDTLEKNGDIGKKVILLASDGGAGGIISAELQNERDIGIFIAEYYKSNIENNGLESGIGEVIRKFRQSGDLLLPEIEIKDKKAMITSASVIKDYACAGSLDAGLLDGYLWVKGRLKDRTVSAKYKGEEVVLKIGSAKRRIKFYESADGISARVSIEAACDIKETGAGLEDKDLPGLKRVLEEKIARSISESAGALQQKYGADVYGFLGELRKKNYDLYLRLCGNWDENFKKLSIIPNIKLKIANPRNIP